MMDEALPVVDRAYLLKVLSGVLLLVGMVTLASLLEWSTLSSVVRTIVLATLLLAALGIVLCVNAVFRRMDELNRKLHQLASASTLPWLAAASAALGALQAAGLLPSFNQCWMLGAIVCIWGMKLMLADRQYR